MTILYICDGCGLQHEHSGPEIPNGWASIAVEVRWQVGKSDCTEWVNDSPTLLCNSCRGDEGDALAEQASKGIRSAVDRRPKDARA